MRSATEIEEALCQALPGHLHPLAAIVAPLFVEVASGALSAEQLQQRLTDNQSLQVFVETLAGKQVTTSESVINFGSGNTAGDVRIGDVAGRDIVKINLYSGRFESLKPGIPLPAQVYLLTITPGSSTVTELRRRLKLRGLQVGSGGPAATDLDHKQLRDAAICVVHVCAEQLEQVRRLRRDIDALDAECKARELPVLILRDTLSDDDMDRLPIPPGWPQHVLAPGTAGLDAAATAILGEVIRAHPDLIKDGSIEVGLFTGAPSGPTGEMALMLDWQEEYRQAYPDPATWDSLLLPAIGSLREVLGAAKVNQIVLNARARLAAGLALGYAFRSTTETSFRIRQGPVWWHTAAHDKNADLLVEQVLLDQEAGGLSIELNITQPRGKVSNDAAHSLNAQNIQVGRRVSLELPEGMGHQLSDEQAQAIASQVRRVMQDSHKPGDTHLFMAVPLGLAVMIGWHLNTLTPVQCYEMPEGATTYEPACRLVKL